MLIKVGVHGEPFYQVSISSSGYGDSMAKLLLWRLAEITEPTPSDAPTPPPEPPPRRHTTAATPAANSRRRPCDLTETVC